VNQREAMKQLLERSSLGTPGARSLRARSDPTVVRRILDRARKGRVDAPMTPLTITCDASHDHDSRDCLVEFFLDSIEAKAQLGPEGDASILPLTITCDASQPGSPPGHDCRDCLVEFCLDNTEPTPIGIDLRAVLDRLSAAGLEPQVQSNRPSSLPGHESKAG
jgi:hypothetical protein